MHQHPEPLDLKEQRPHQRYYTLSMLAHTQSLVGDRFWVGSEVVPGPSHL